MSEADYTFLMGLAGLVCGGLVWLAILLNL